MRDGGFERALVEERVSRNTSEGWEPVYSLAPGLPDGEACTENEQTELTTQHN
jgi:hypothetical protein